MAWPKTRSAALCSVPMRLHTYDETNRRVRPALARKRRDDAIRATGHAPEMMESVAN